MKDIFKVLFIFLAAVSLSWILTCGILKLIALCFNITFSLAIATGIWLILWLLGSIFKK